jgi:hypothetical protein
MRSRVLALGLACLAAVGGSAADAPRVKRVATETPITAFEYGKHKRLMVALAQDGRRFVFARKADPGWSVEVDGKVEATYKDVGPPDERYKEYPFVANLPGIKSISLSRDGQHVAYNARQDDGWAVVHDGKAGKAFKSLWGPVLSEDGQHLVYAAQVPGGWRVVRDGVEGTLYEKVGPPAVSADGLHVGYAARAEGKEMLVRDGVEGKAYESLDAPPGGLGALIAKLLFSSMVPTWPVFSSDGRLAYMAKQVGKWHMVVEGAESEAFEDVNDPYFSPDGKRLAYAAKKQGSWSVLVDGKAYGSFKDEVTTRIVFSADSQHVAFVAKTDGKETVFVDGRQIGRHDEVSLPVFSPDGRRVAYTAKEHGKWTVTLDGVAQGPYVYLEAYRPVFSPDGSHLAFEAAQRRWMADDRKVRIVVDGVDGKPYEDMVVDLADFNLMLPGAVFDDNSRLHYLAVQNKQIVLVEEQLSTETARN